MSAEEVVSVANLGRFEHLFDSGRTDDVIGVVSDYPSCPGIFSLSFNQGFDVVLGSQFYHLTTTNSVAISFDGQDWTISVTMTHP
jgi:hypothetical protein